MKVVKQLFSMSLRYNRGWASVELGERQEMANRFFRKRIKKKTPLR